GVKLGAGETIMPDPVLVGRDRSKLEKLSELSGVKKISTDLAETLADPANTIYFDSQTTGRRADAVRQSVKAGKHIYCEKPIAVDTKTALDLYKICTDAKLKNGVVQDKLWLPGILKLKRLIQQGFFQKIPVE